MSRKMMLEADPGAQRQYQNLAGLVPFRMADEGAFAGCTGRGPEHNVADAVVLFRVSGAFALFRG